MSKKRKGVQDIILIIWMGIFAIHLISINQLENQRTLLIHANELLSYCHGVFLYSYVVVFLKQNQKPIRLPVHFLGVVIYAYVVIHLLPHYWEKPVIILSAKVVLTGIYLLMTYRLVKNTIMDENQTKQIKSWIFFLIVGIGILLIIPVGHLLLHSKSLVATQNLVGNIAYSLFLMILGFWGIRIAPIFIPHSAQIQKSATKPKYNASALSAIEKNKLFKALEELMETTSPFLDATLTIKKVSKMLGVSSNQLSEIINSQHGNNFNDYINKYRVRELTAKIDNQEHQKKTLLALAHDCGFNSKPSFNRAFRKHVGSTPSEYIKRNNP
ncbi:helix-turn-helix domain-containing protein [Ulvibacterium sp.]|uniref:helix-turn-helix domain-containing protein n=1 Tax=Ulvibacterium sp. TaxID=2665914 RepID=UPI003BADAC55